MPDGLRLRMLVLLLLWVFTFWPLYPELLKEWMGNADNSHAVLVPFLALFFGWQKRGKLKEAVAEGSAWGGAVFGLSLLTYVISSAGGLVFPARASMVMSLVGLVWFCLGSTFVRLLAFPIGLLFFMVPLPYSILSLVTLPLQLLATRGSAALITTCGIPVRREGNMLFFQQTQLEVAEACSGIRSMSSLLMLAVVISHLSGGSSAWRKGFIIAAAIPIAILLNIARIAGTGVLAHYYREGVARGWVHEFSGVLVFVAGLGALIVLFSRWGGGRDGNAG